MPAKAGWTKAKLLNRRIVVSRSSSRTYLVFALAIFLILFYWAVTHQQKLRRDGQGPAHYEWHDINPHESQTLLHRENDTCANTQQGLFPDSPLPLVKHHRCYTTIVALALTSQDIGAF